MAKSELEADQQEDVANSHEAPQTDLQQEDTAQQLASDSSGEVAEPRSNPSWVEKSKHFCLHKKKISIPLGIVVLLGLLFGVPVTRYALAGTVLKQTATITVVDNETKKPVSEADVTLAGQTIRTNAEGKASFTVRVGNQHMLVAKKYYKEVSSTVLVPIGKQLTLTQWIDATGRQVSVTVVNTITGAAVENASINLAGTSAKTDKKGNAVVVVPPTAGPFDAVVAGSGFNDQKVKITAKQDSVAVVAVKLTPTGKVYFLSKLSGKIDVVKTNLDGTGRETILAGTGREEEAGTSLLASRDWKYVVLQARREGDRAKLYLINTATDKVTTMDEGDATFTSAGWAGHNFVYEVTRDKYTFYQPKRNALKSYNAETGQITVIDETTASGGQYDYKAEYLAGTFVSENEVVWIKNQNYAYYINPNDVSSTVSRADIDGKNKQVIKSIAATSYISGIRYEPNELLLTWYENNKNVVYKYQNKTVTEDKENTVEVFSKPYPTYLLSPGGKKTFWTESRDGKNFLFVGDADGGNAKSIATLADYSVYGWFSDDYLLVSKKGSELYILSVAGVKDESGVVKISDYHKPQLNYRGYGGGYGGL